MVHARAHGSEANAKTFDAPGFVRHTNDARAMLARSRLLLAQAPEAEYVAAAKVAGERRKAVKGGVAYIVQVAASYLFPTERGWVEADVARFERRHEIAPTSELRTWWSEHAILIVCSITTFADVLAMNGVTDASKLPDSPHDLPLTPTSMVEPCDLESRDGPVRPNALPRREVAM